MSGSNSINIQTLAGQSYKIDFIPEEPVWSFSKRAGARLCDGLTDGGTTNRYRLMSNCKVFNTFENRLKTMGSLFPQKPEKMYACLWDLRPGCSHIFKGNSSPLGGERSICAICLSPIEEISSGEEDNPMISTTLKCGHAFHTGCIEPIKKSEGALCPTCKAPLTS